MEAIEKVLKTLLHRMVRDHKSKWNLTLFYALWAYRTSVKAATGFTPFHLVYGLEFVLLIECQIPSLKLAVEIIPNTSTEEETFMYLINLDETRRDATLANEAHKKHVKA